MAEKFSLEIERLKGAQNEIAGMKKINISYKIDVESLNNRIAEAKERTSELKTHF